MIHIGGDLYIDGKTSEILLKQRKVSKQGNEYYSILGRYRNMQQMLDALTDKEIRLSFGEAKMLIQVNRAVADIHKMIEDFCNKYGKEIEERLREESGDE